MQEDMMAMHLLGADQAFMHRPLAVMAMIECVAGWLLASSLALLFIHKLTPFVEVTTNSWLMGAIPQHYTLSAWLFSGLIAVVIPVFAGAALPYIHALMKARFKSLSHL